MQLCLCCGQPVLRAEEKHATPEAVRAYAQRNQDRKEMEEAIAMIDAVLEKVRRNDTTREQ